MTKELHEDIKLHLDWLVKRLTVQGYDLKEVVDLLKSEITNVRDGIIIDLHLDDKRNCEIVKLTGCNHTMITIVTGKYWKSKNIGFKEEKKRNI